MQNIVINMCEKFRYDWLRNDRVLGNEKSDNNKNNNNNNNNNKNVRSHWSLVSGFKKRTALLARPRRLLPHEPTPYRRFSWTRPLNSDISIVSSDSACVQSRVRDDQNVEADSSSSTSKDEMESLRTRDHRDLCSECV